MSNKIFVSKSKMKEKQFSSGKKGETLHLFSWKYS